MPLLAPINKNSFTFPYAKKWSVLGMNYEKCPRHSIIQYRNLIDHLGPNDFVWMPYEGLDHQPNPDDAAVWTAKTPIIRFTTVEMHQSDRVKLQFGMHQDIPDAPVDLGKWHQKRVDAQWMIGDWKEFAKELRVLWKRRRQYVLTDSIVHGARPSLQYMTWFSSVMTTQPFLSQPTYLSDPREHGSSSYPQIPTDTPHQQQPPYEDHQQQPPYEDTPHSMPTYTPYQQQPPYMPPIQSQSQPTHQYNPDMSFDPTPATYIPDNSFDPTPSNYTSNHPLFNYHTPQQPTHLDQPNSMYTFGQPYRPYSTHPPRQSYQNMGIALDYESACDMGPPGYWGQMMQDLADTPGPSQQNPPPQLNTQHPDTPQQHRRRPRRNTRPPQCGTGGHLDRADH
ncbi:unnamed protein product [Lathyrus sativus]|nr:unnamed protein product [Lathyrus sativus]